jgi:flagellar assembly factor FliW
VTRALRFTVPPFGLEPYTDFALAPVEGAVGLFRLTAAGDPSLRLFVLDAAVHLPDYRPDVSIAHRTEVGLTETDSPELFVVVTPGAGTSTVNLLAPIVVNARTGSCQQVILADSTFGLREPLLAPA